MKRRKIENVSKTLGQLSKLSSQTLIKILTFLSPGDVLHRIAPLNKKMYHLTTLDELWKEMTMTRYPSAAPKLRETPFGKEHDWKAIFIKLYLDCCAECGLDVREFNSRNFYNDGDPYFYLIDDNLCGKCKLLPKYKQITQYKAIHQFHLKEKDLEKLRCKKTLIGNRLIKTYLLSDVQKLRDELKLENKETKNNIDTEESDESNTEESENDDEDFVSCYHQTYHFSTKLKKLLELMIVVVHIIL